ncbi:MAG: RecX family transcriptional regulator [Clostridiales bacterium]|nr:RecX family transcriptional regulator [Clostridiales bacterium]
MDDAVKYSEARNKAIKHIGLSVSSSGKTTEYLQNLGFDRELVREVVDQLIEDGYVDDRKVARKIIRQRSGAKSESRMKLFARLEEAGVSRQLIEQVFDEEDVNDEETIMEVIRDRFPVDSFSDDPREVRNQIAKAVRYLESRGYSTSLAVASFRKLIHDVE